MKVKKTVAGGVKRKASFVAFFVFIGDVVSKVERSF